MSTRRQLLVEFEMASAELIRELMRNPPDDVNKNVLDDEDNPTQVKEGLLKHINKGRELAERLGGDLFSLGISFATAGLRVVIRENQQGIAEDTNPGEED